MTKHLLTFYTRTPLHVGCGTSVDVVDLPIMRERITGFPVVPGSSIKGVLLQHAREVFDEGQHARSSGTLPDAAKVLFGAIDTEGSDRKHVSNAGCIQIMEAKLLAFPVRSLAGCFAWITCPAALERFQRDSGKSFIVPQPGKSEVVAGSDLTVQKQVVFEEYPLTVINGSISDVAAALEGCTNDPLWTSKLKSRLAIVSDEMFQQFVTTCTEVVARIVIDPMTRTNTNLFNQENIPCETLFYSVLTVVASRRNNTESQSTPNALLDQLLPIEKPPLLQIGGDETTGHGICETKREVLNA
ncbi:MAG: type III-B CRISPR module RAMP protein Cmr4 [Verrucomicrobiota bacterium]